MTTVAILPTSNEAGERIYRAIAGDKQSTGKTAGEALDALTLQIGEHNLAPLLLFQSFSPDWLFTVDQQQRLGHLMDLWRNARDANQHLPTEQQTELDQLVEAELNAATARSLALLQQTGA